MNEIELAETGRQRYEEGRQALRLGDLPRAISLFRDAVKARPHFKTLELLGSALLEQGELTDAAIYLAASAAMNPKQSKPRFLLAQAMLALGQTWKSDAVQQLQECLRLNANYANARQLLEHLLKEDPSLSDDSKG
jgi:predicted Zn-dependent protease